jgi:hypothetical protein
MISAENPHSRKVGRTPEYSKSRRRISATSFSLSIICHPDRDGLLEPASHGFDA